MSAVIMAFSDKGIRTFDGVKKEDYNFSAEDDQAIKDLKKEAHKDTTKGVVGGTVIGAAGGALAGKGIQMAIVKHLKNKYPTPKKFAERLKDRAAKRKEGSAIRRRLERLAARFDETPQQNYEDELKRYSKSAIWISALVGGGLMSSALVPAKVLADKANDKAIDSLASFADSEDEDALAEDKDLDAEAKKAAERKAKIKKMAIRAAIAAGAIAVTAGTAYGVKKYLDAGKEKEARALAQKDIPDLKKALADGKVVGVVFKDKNTAEVFLKEEKSRFGKFWDSIKGIFKVSNKNKDGTFKKNVDLKKENPEAVKKYEEAMEMAFSTKDELVDKYPSPKMISDALDNEVNEKDHEMHDLILKLKECDASDYSKELDKIFENEELKEKVLKALNVDDNKPAESNEKPAEEKKEESPSESTEAQEVL